MYDDENDYGNNRRNRKSRFSLVNVSNKLKNNKKKIVSGAVGVALLTSLYPNVYTLDSGENAVISRFGNYYETQTAGLNWKIPFIDSKEIVDVKKVFSSRTGVGVYEDGSEGLFIPEAQMLTGDENLAEVKSVAQYTISDPVKYVFVSDHVDEILKRAQESSVRLSVGNNSIDSLITNGRAVIAQSAKDKLQEIVDEYNLGISIQDLQFSYAKAPQGKVQDAFDRVTTAKEKRQEAINKAQTYQNKVVPEARGEAAKIVNQAQAYGQGVINAAQGQAQGFNLLLKEYQKAPQITRERMWIDTMAKVMPNLEGKILVEDPNALNLWNGGGMFPQNLGGNQK